MLLPPPSAFRNSYIICERLVFVLAFLWLYIPFAALRTVHKHFIIPYLHHGQSVVAYYLHIHYIEQSSNG